MGLPTYYPIYLYGFKNVRPCSIVQHYKYDFRLFFLFRKESHQSQGPVLLVI